MKWSIAGLLLLGIAAAVSASVLVAALKVTNPAVAATQVSDEKEIIVAKRNMPAMTIVDGRSVEVKKVAATDAPADALSRPTDVIGKLLTVPVVEGQTFSSTSFADEKSGARLASALASGMRAVSIGLTAERAGLLYPGCIVDVMVSITRSGGKGSTAKEAVSMTLLQAVEVLAVDDSSVVSEPPKEDDSETAAKSRRTHRERLVTLMLNSNQAKALQLATQYGAVSLALRNPLDSEPVEHDSTTLSELRDEYSRLLAVLSPELAGGEDAEELAAAAPATTTATAEAPKPVEPAAAPAVAEKPEAPQWQTVVNRGGEIEVVRFSRDGEPTSEADPEWKWAGKAAGPKGPK